MRRVSSIWWQVFAVIGTMSACGGFAHSQQVSLAAEFGFQGQYVSGRWAPITAWISAGDRAIDGLLLVEFPQDGSQRARIAVPFATTPNRVVPVEVVTSLPLDCPEVRFTVMRSGAKPQTWRYAAIPVRADPLPAGWPEQTGLVVSVGSTSARYVIGRGAGPVGEDYSEELVDEVEREESSTPWSGRMRQQTQAMASSAGDLGTFRHVTIGPDRLPRAWAAYDGVTALIVNVGEMARVDTRAVEAVREWVAAGGALVLIAGAAGEQWRDWIPGGQTLPIELDPVSVVKPSRLVDGPERNWLVASVTGRAVRMREDGVGWRQHWRLDDPARASLMAEGPAGFGWVVVLGVDPERALAEVTRANLREAWGTVLAQPTRSWEFRTASPTSTSQQFGAWGPGQEWSRTSTATAHTLQRLATVPPTGGVAFVVICLAFVALAGLLGPVDALLLKHKHLSHRSWLTALGWIGLASVLALSVPPLLRAGPTTVNRVACLDVIATADGTRSNVFESAVTGIFTGQRATLKVGELEGAEGSWVRGVSALDYDWRWGVSRGREPTAVLETVQMPGQPGVGNTLPEIKAGIWTFRTFLEQRHARSDIAGRIVDDDRGWRVEIRGLPKESHITDGALRIASAWMTLDPGPATFTDGSPVLWFAREETERSSPPGAWDITTMTNLTSWYEHSPSRVQSVHVASMLPGADRRGEAIDFYASSSRYGVVYLCVTLEEPYRDVGVRSVGRTEMVYRIVLPVVMRSEAAGHGEGKD